MMSVQGDWRLFQLYMLIIVLILPSIIMTAAYTSISRKLLSLTDTEQSLNRSKSRLISLRNISPEKRKDKKNNIDGSNNLHTD